MWNPNSSTRRRRSASGPSAMRAPRLRAQARVHQLEVGEQLAGVGVAGLGRAVEQVVEAVADEAQLAAVGLVEVLVADLGARTPPARPRRAAIERSSSSLTGTMRVETPVARASSRTSTR